MIERSLETRRSLQTRARTLHPWRVEPTPTDLLPEKWHRWGYAEAERVWLHRDQLSIPHTDERIPDDEIPYDDDELRTHIPADDDPAATWVTSGDELRVDYTRVNGTPGGGLPTVRTNARCGKRSLRGRYAGQRCPMPAGTGTAHYGAGDCLNHGGGKSYQRAYGAWLMAHAYAAQLDVDPWEALLMSVRIAAGKVAYIESVLGTARSDLELEGRAVDAGDGNGLIHPDTGQPLTEYRDLSWWVAKGEYWHMQLARCAKMAVDAGVAAWVAQRMEADASALARVLTASIEALDLDDEQEALMRGAMRAELMKLDAEQTAVSGALASATPRQRG